MDGVALWSGGIRMVPAEGVFPLGTDAVLLAAFAGMSGVKRMLDLGCGSGVVSLLLAERSPQVHGVGVDLQSAAVENARQNAILNGMENRLTFQLGDLRDYKKMAGAGAYDLVTANPPYFQVESGFSAAGVAAVARQEHTCTLAEVCAAAGYFTRWGGRFALVHRPERLADIVRAMTAAGLELKRLRFVQARPDAAPNLLLAEARRGAKPGLIVEPPLLLTNPDGGDTDEVKRIYHRI